jgi:hypothetical protein
MCIRNIIIAFAFSYHQNHFLYEILHVDNLIVIESSRFSVMCTQLVSKTRCFSRLHLLFAMWKAAGDESGYLDVVGYWDDPSGVSVGISGDGSRVVIGRDPLNDANGKNSGQAVVFVSSNLFVNLFLHEQSCIMIAK